MAIFFYMFATLTVLGAVMVIASRNPVHAVLWLIFTFCNGSGLMVLMGAEFIAMMLIIIYVGAVSVLFLFVVMMLDIKFSELKGTINSNMKFALVMAFLLFADLTVIALLGSKTIVPAGVSTFLPVIPAPGGIQEKQRLDSAWSGNDREHRRDSQNSLASTLGNNANANAIGRLLYTEFILPFQTAGIILFVAMVASIALTLRLRSRVRRQKVGQQLARNKENSLALAKVDGIDGLNNLDYDN